MDKPSLKLKLSKKKRSTTEKDDSTFTPRHSTRTPSASSSRSSTSSRQKRSAAQRAAQAVSSLKNLDDDLSDPLASPPPPKVSKSAPRKAFPDIEQLRFHPRSLPLDDLLEELLSKLERADQLAMFLQPVSKAEVPSYYRIIRKPMDLRTMREKVRRGEYTTVQSFLIDFELMVNNALKFNAPSTLFYQTAKDLSDYGRSLIEVEMERTQIRGLTEEESQARLLLSEPIKMIDWVFNLCNELITIDYWSIFTHPVPIHDYPDYLSYVPQPMDISTMKKKAEEDEYLTLGEVRSDIVLIAMNAFRYNQPNSEIFNMARNFLFDGLDLWTKLSRHRVVIPPQKTRKRLDSMEKERPAKKSRRSLPPDQILTTVPSASMRQLQTRLRQILSTLENEDTNLVFARPPDNVKKPIDYNTLRNDIDSQRFKSLVDFKLEIDQMFKNAIQFTDPSSLFHITATNLSPLVSKLFLQEAQKTGDLHKYPHIFADSEQSVAVSVANPPPAYPSPVPTTTTPSKIKKKEVKTPKKVKKEKPYPYGVAATVPSTVCNLDDHGGRMFFSRHIQRYNCDESAVYCGPFASIFDLSRLGEYPLTEVIDHKDRIDSALAYYRCLPKVNGVEDMISYLSGKPVTDDSPSPPPSVPKPSVKEEWSVEWLKETFKGQVGIAKDEELLRIDSKEDRVRSIATLLLNVVNNESDTTSMFELRNLMVDLIKM
ncbi:hypothetical protein P9112_002502 [Eukaryota sp. TZLM1-RC]